MSKNFLIPDGYKIEESLNANGIYGEVIGKITDNKNRVVINGDETRYLEPQEVMKYTNLFKKGDWQ